MAKPPPPESLPVPSDVPLVLRRLGAEERERRERLAAMEERVRRFADVERPAYERWRRLEFGPALAALEDARATLRARSLIAERAAALIDDEGLAPRDALRVALGETPRPAAAARAEQERDAVSARRRAKLERKRSERRAAKRAQRAVTKPDAPAATSAGRAGVVGLFRSLARRLHPDSPSAIRSLDPPRLRSAWSDVQAAYAARDRERLLAVSSWLDAMAGDEVPPSESAAPPDGAAAVGRRLARLRALDRACAALERRVLHLAHEPGWDFERRRRDDGRGLRADTETAIAHEAERLRDALGEVEEFLASLRTARRR